MELCVQLINMTLEYYCTTSLSYIIKVIFKFTPSLGRPGLLDLQILVSSNWKIMELMSVVSQDDGHRSVTSERWI